MAIRPRFRRDLKLFSGKTGNLHAFERIFGDIRRVSGDLKKPRKAAVFFESGGISRGNVRNTRNFTDSRIGRITHLAPITHRRRSWSCADWTMFLRFYLISRTRKNPRKAHERGWFSFKAPRAWGERRIIRIAYPPVRRSHRAPILAVAFNRREKEAGRPRGCQAAAHISKTERRSVASERDTFARYMAVCFSERIGERMDGRITGVSRARLFIRLHASAARRLCPRCTSAGRHYRFELSRFAVVGHSRGQAYRIGDTVRVAVAEANPLTGGLILDVLPEKTVKANHSTFPSFCTMNRFFSFFIFFCLSRNLSTQFSRRFVFSLSCSKSGEALPPHSGASCGNSLMKDIPS